jgi:hypothetical protein
MWDDYANPEELEEGLLGGAARCVFMTVAANVFYSRFLSHVLVNAGFLEMCLPPLVRGLTEALTMSRYECRQLAALATFVIISSVVERHIIHHSPCISVLSLWLSLVAVLIPAAAHDPAFMLRLFALHFSDFRLYRGSYAVQNHLRRFGAILMRFCFGAAGRRRLSGPLLWRWSARGLRTDALRLVSSLV